MMQAGWVESLKPSTAAQEDYYDTKILGLGLRVSSKGTKTWFVRYRAGERRERLTIGRFPAISLAEAREKAAEVVLRVQRGDDPASEKKADERALTFDELAQDYLARHATKNRTVDEQRRILEKDVIPAWKGKKSKDVSRADVIKLGDAIAARGAPIMANRTLNLVGRVFRWGMRRALVDQNPAALIETPGEEKERDRVLSDSEIRSLWKAADKGGQVGALLKLALLTGQRRGEFEQMRWQDIDLKGGWWTIPSEHAKNKQFHRVPLSPPAIAILRGIEAAGRKRKWESDWVFPSRIGAGKHPVGNIQKRVDAIRSNAGGADWHVHDIRRTVATQLGRLGVSRFLIGKLLNHTSLAASGLARVTAVYDRYEYDAEKRDALVRWAEQLEEVLARKVVNVREIRKASGRKAAHSARA
jgi:integrase